MFAGLPEETCRELAARTEPVELAAGEWLFRAGDPADALYVVRSGRLEVVGETEDGRETVLRVLQRGAALGELALLARSPRSASVRARRDSALLRLGHQDFSSLLAARPEFALGLSRNLGRQLQESRARAIPRPLTPALVALVPTVAGAPTDQVSHRLAAALGAWESVAGLDGDEEGDRADLLDRAEREHGRVLLTASHPDPADPWTAFCLRHADRVLAVAPADDAPGRRDGLRGSDLVVWGWRPGGGRAVGWAEAVSPRAVHLVAAGDEGAGIERLARRLAGRALGVVLSGGGARGLAHIGVLEALEAAGVSIDRVGGCSMGALVGGMLAAGRGPAEIAERMRAEFVERNPLNDYTVPLAALARGRKAQAMLERVFEDAAIEELHREFFCVSCDLLSAELFVHRRGLLRDAVGASACLPGIVPPVSAAGRLLVDGGVLNNLPVQQMAERGEGPVIAVDVSSRFQPPAVAGRRPRARPLRAALVGWDHPLPSFQETLVRTVALGSIDTAAAAQRHADVTILPEVSGFGLMRFDRLDEIRAAGRQAAAEALAGQPAPLAP